MIDFSGPSYVDSIHQISDSPTLRGVLYIRAIVVLPLSLQSTSQSGP